MSNPSMLLCCRPFCPVLFYLLFSTLFFTALIIPHTIRSAKRRKTIENVCMLHSAVKLAGNFIIAIINSSSSSGEIQANSSNRAVCKMRASNRIDAYPMVSYRFWIHAQRTHIQTRARILYRAISESFKRQSHFVFFLYFGFDHHETVLATLLSSGVSPSLTLSFLLSSNLFAFEGPLSNIANRRIWWGNAVRKWIKFYLYIHKYRRQDTHREKERRMKRMKRMNEWTNECDEAGGRGSETEKQTMHDETRDSMRLCIQFGELFR